MEKVVRQMVNKAKKQFFAKVLPVKTPVMPRRPDNRGERSPAARKENKLTGKPMAVPAKVVRDSMGALLDEVDASGEFDAVSPQTKFRIERYVTEYVKDFNGVRAALRFGCGTPRYAVKVANGMKSHPYFQKVLHVVVRSMQEKQMFTRSQVIAGLVREANDDTADSSSRTRALVQLSKIYGMEVVRLQGEVTHTSKVIVIPAGMSLEEWQAAAELQQQQIKQLPASAVTVEDRK